MPLAVLYDDRLEPLADALVGWLSRARASDPFDEDTVLVPDVGTGRWLAQRVAASQGVCARVRFELPGRFFWRTLRELIPQLPARSPFEPQTARWTILRLFDELGGAPECEPLLRRTAGASIADRLALAGEIAEQFERYLVLRRDWLERWQRGGWAQGAAPLGPHEGWQRWLWRELLARLPDVSRTHPYDRLEGVLAAQPPRGAESELGPRVAVFGAIALSQDQMRLLARLSAGMQITAFVADPCRELWSDLVDAKSLARIRSERPDLAWLYQDEPQVLGLWGRAQRDRVAQWLMLEEADDVHAAAPFRDRAHPLDALCAAPASEAAGVAASMPRDLTRLAALHAAILLRSDRPWALLADTHDDRSIGLHATHGSVRAAEVLHDQLLECFESMPGLRPDQVVVLCANLDDSADAIEAVFASAPAARRIPVGLSGRRARVDPMQRATVEFLEFALAGAHLSALETWLANPAVLDALSLDAQDAAALIDACECAGVRWGIDSRRAPPKHGWRAGLDRLVLGAALGGAVGQFEGVAPVSGLRRTGDDVFERLLVALDSARALRSATLSPRPLAQWCALVRETLDTVFARASRWAESLARVHAALAELSEGASGEPGCALDATAFRQALDDALDRGAGAAIASGAVTVCPLGGLRAIPFRVVVLFGLDEAVFPRTGARGEFDLIARSPRFGDRVAGADDRGVFLDALLAARERVVVIYCGHDPRDDTPRNPSTLVTELIEYVNARQPAGYAALEPVVHPLHPFSPRAFASAERASFASQWLETARALRLPIEQRAVAIGPITGTRGATRGARAAPAALPPEPGELNALRDALADPARAYLQGALGLSLPRTGGAVSEVEPLAASEADDRALVDDVAQRLVQGASQQELLEELRASPGIAAGAPGEVQARAVLAAAVALSRRGLDLAAGGAAGAPLGVSAFNLGMHALVGAWLRHAFWAAANQAAAREAESYLVTPDATVRVRIADAGAAIAHARDSVERVRACALPLFPKAARALLDGAALHKVHDALFGDDAGWSTGEIDKPWFAALYRDGRPDLDEVAQVAREVYGPILADCRVEKAET